MAGDKFFSLQKRHRSIAGFDGAASGPIRAIKRRRGATLFSCAFGTPVAATALKKVCIPRSLRPPAVPRRASPVGLHLPRIAR